MLRHPPAEFEALWRSPAMQEPHQRHPGPTSFRARNPENPIRKFSKFKIFISPKSTPGHLHDVPTPSLGHPSALRAALPRPSPTLLPPVLSQASGWTLTSAPLLHPQRPDPFFVEISKISKNLKIFKATIPPPPLTPLLIPPARPRGAAERL